MMYGSYTAELHPAVHAPQLGNDRPVQVLLPPGYAPDSARRYPVLYLNDGQDVPALGLLGTLDQLYAAHAFEPPVVVAVHTNAFRLLEYGTAGIANAQGLGSRAAAYSRFLTEELRPLIAARYQVDLRPERTALAGFSLGGLSAFDIAWAHPELFGIVGVFSGSFWWRTDDRSWRTKQRSRIMHRRVRQTQRPVRLRVWMQTGTEDETADRDGDGIIDAIQDTTELIAELVARGYAAGTDVVYREVLGGRHDQKTWGRVMPEFLTWAFPAEAKK